MLRPKNTKVLRELLCMPYDPVLVTIVCELNDKLDILVVTEGYREPLHKGDIHSTIPVRAIDIRSWIYDKPHDIVKHINNEWEYDFNRPAKQVAIYHSTKGGAKHIHIQVHHNTRRKLT